MTLESLLDHSLTTAASALTLAQEILDAPEYFWRFIRPASF